MSLNLFFTGQTTTNVSGPAPSANHVDVGGAASGAGDGVFANGFLQALLTEIMDSKEDTKQQQAELLREQEALSQQSKTELPFEVLVETSAQYSADTPNVDGQERNVDENTAQILPVENEGEQSLPVDNMVDIAANDDNTVRKTENSDTALTDIPPQIDTPPQTDETTLDVIDSAAPVIETSAEEGVPLTDRTDYTLNVQALPQEQLDILPSLFQAQGVQTDIDFKPSFGELKDTLAQLEKQMSGDESGSELILSNLTPDQVSQLKAYLNDPENAPEPDFTLFIGTVKLTPPQGMDTQTAQQELIVLMQNNPGTSLATQLNALITSGGENKNLQTIEDQLAKLRSGEAVGEQYKDALNKPDAKSPAAATNSANAGDPDGAVKPDLSALQNWMFSVSGTLFSSMGESFEGLLEQMGLTSAAQSAPNSPANLAGLMSANQAAGTPHPASQMVAASIKKAAHAGDTTDIKLRLDPPDLGRLEVKLQFDGTGKLKTTIAVEKPEAYLMLQRDVHILERALQDSGVETDGDISFEMFQEGEQEFSHNGGHDGQGPFAEGQGDSSDNEEDVIYTSMNWMATDPETGHTHYSILA